MVQISKKLRSIAGNGLMYWCQGCEQAHTIVYGAGGWSWNGDVDRPVFSPSVLVRGRNFTPAGRTEYEKWYAAGCPSPAPTFESRETVCHTFIGCNGAQPGQVIFLSDCTHALAGQVAELPDLPPHMEDV